MLVVETLAKIRRDRLVHGKSIRAIAKTRGVSRNTVRKVLRSDETSLEPVYHRRKQPRPKLGHYEALLEALLLSNHQTPRYDRLNFLKMFELLRDDGYHGGYDTVRRYALLWQQHHGHSQDAFIPLHFKPGEAYQFDWSHETVVLGGITQTVKVAHVRLCNSRMRFVSVTMHYARRSPLPRHEVIELMTTLKFAGMRLNYDEIVTAGRQRKRGFEAILRFAGSGDRR